MTDLSPEHDEVGNLVVASDEPPKSGVWVDTDDVLANLTEEELEEGRRHGESIDIDDDEDSGVDHE